MTFFPMYRYHTTTTTPSLARNASRRGFTHLTPPPPSPPPPLPRSKSKTEGFVPFWTPTPPLSCSKHKTEGFYSSDTTTPPSLEKRDGGGFVPFPRPTPPLPRSKRETEGCRHHHHPLPCSKSKMEGVYPISDTFTSPHSLEMRDGGDDKGNDDGRTGLYTYTYIKESLLVLMNVFIPINECFYKY